MGGKQRQRKRGKRMKYLIVEKATGEVIDIVEDKEEAEFEVKNFEKVDEDAGTYVPHAYDIVDADE